MPTHTAWFNRWTDFLNSSPQKLEKEKTKQKVVDVIPEVDEKQEGIKKKNTKSKEARKAQEIKKSGRPIINRRAKYPQIYGKKRVSESQKRISDNSGVLTMANFLSDTDNVSTHDEPEKTPEVKSPVPPRKSKSPGIATVFSAKKTAMAWKTKIDDRFDPETQACFHFWFQIDSLKMSKSQGLNWTVHSEKGHLYKKYTHIYVNWQQKTVIFLERLVYTCYKVFPPEILMTI